MHELEQAAELARDALQRELAAECDAAAKYLALSKTEELFLAAHEKAILKVQRLARSRVARRVLAQRQAELLLMDSHERAVLKIQQRVRGRRTQLQYRQTLAQRAESDRVAAMRIQSGWRSRQARDKVKCKRVAAKCRLEAFERYDADRSGMLDPAELRQLMREQGKHMSDKQFEAFLKKIDTDGDGQISLDEFLQAFDHRAARKPGDSSANGRKCVARVSAWITVGRDE